MSSMGRYATPDENIRSTSTTSENVQKTDSSKTAITSTRLWTGNSCQKTDLSSKAMHSTNWRTVNPDENTDSATTATNSNRLRTVYIPPNTDSPSRAMLSTNWRTVNPDEKTDSATTNSSSTRLWTDNSGQKRYSCSRAMRSTNWRTVNTDEKAVSSTTAVENANLRTVDTKEKTDSSITAITSTLKPKRKRLRSKRKRNSSKDKTDLSTTAIKTTSLRTVNPDQEKKLSTAAIDEIGTYNPDEEKESSTTATDEIGTFNPEQHTVSFPTVDIENIRMRTFNPVHNIIFVLCIHNFSKLTDSLHTEEFALVEACAPRWKCGLIISTTRNNVSELDLEFYREDDDVPVKVHGDFKMLNSKGFFIGETKSVSILSPYSNNFIVLTAPHPLKQRKKQKRVDLPDDKLIIQGEMKINGCCISTTTLTENCFRKHSAKKTYQCILHASADGSELDNTCSSGETWYEFSKEIE